MPRIMVATDGSAGANRALDAGAMLARSMDAELVILTVGGNLSGAQVRQLASVEEDLSDALELAADQILSQAQKRALRNGALTVRLQTAWGDPAEAIIDVVEVEKADILVVGRRGRGRLSGLVLGSVSQKLASLAPCKVLIVP